MSRTRYERDERPLGKSSGREELAGARDAPRPEPAPYSIRWCPRGRSAVCAWAAANVSLRGDLRESAMLDPSGLTPWAAVRRARCSILCSRSRIRGTGNPPGFSAGNSWKSLKLTPLLSNARANGRVSGPLGPKCSVQFHKTLSAPTEASVSAPAQREDAPRQQSPRHRPADLSESVPLRQFS